MFRLVTLCLFLSACAGAALPVPDPDLGHLPTCTSGMSGVACGDECVDVLRSPEHCGACDTPCPSGQACQAGRCTSTCSNGTLRCGDACIDTRTDELHCGGCNQPCATGL